MSAVPPETRRSGCAPAWSERSAPRRPVRRRPVQAAGDRAEDGTAGRVNNGFMLGVSWRSSVDRVTRPGAAARRARRACGWGVAEPGQRLVGRAVVLADAVDRPGLRAAWPRRGAVRARCAICSTCCTLVMRSPFRPHRLSSMPTRTCRPIAMAIVFSGSTLRMIDSMVSTAPAGTRRTNSIMLVRVRAVGPAADADPVQHQRAGVDAAADQSLDRFELAGVAEHEVRLDAVGLQSLQVLGDEVRTRRDPTSRGTPPGRPAARARCRPRRPRSAVRRRSSGWC